MKKLIGIILALCMLGTMASAATIENPNATATLSTMTVSVTYTALANNAQATLFAYKVANDATLDNAESIAYKNQTDTPIVGIDQEASDGTFDFKVDAAFRGKIAVKVGGADVATPVTMLVEFADPVTPPVNPDPEPDPEPDEPDEPEYVEVTVYCGDVDGDGDADADDATYILLSTIGGKKDYAAYAIGSTITAIEGINIVCGDVDGDTDADADDATYILLSTIGGKKDYAKYPIGSGITFNVPKE